MKLFEILKNYFFSSINHSQKTPEYLENCKKFINRPFFFNLLSRFQEFSSSRKNSIRTEPDKNYHNSSF